MRYYTPTIFTVLSPVSAVFCLFTYLGLLDASKALVQVIPTLITDLFGGKNAMSDLASDFLRYSMYFQLITIAAVIVSTPVVNIVFAVKKKFRPKGIAVINFLMKLATIPMYLLLTIAPVIALVGSVWGMGIALAILVLTIVGAVFSAAFSIPSVISGAGYEKFGRSAAFLMGFLSFIPAIDIIIAIVITVLSSKKAVTPQPLVQA